MATTAQESADEASNSESITDAIQSVLDRIQSSVANTILSAGIVLFTIAVILEVTPTDFFLFEHFPNSFEEQKIWAAIFGLWAVGLLLLGSVLRIVTWYMQR